MMRAFTMMPRLSYPPQEGLLQLQLTPYPASLIPQEGLRPQLTPS